jgi:hypothetical protein
VVRGQRSGLRDPLREPLALERAIPSPVKRCKKDRHDLVGDTVGFNKSTGRVYCKPCREETRRAARRAKGKCLAGKHSFAVRANWYETTQGQKRCRPCYLEAKAAREAAAAAAPKYPDVERIPARKARAVPPGGIGGNGEQNALYRLAVRVRQGRGIDVRA